MAIVHNTLSPVPDDRTVYVRLIAPAGWRDNGASEVLAGWSAKADEGGAWSVDLPPQSTYVVASTWYQVVEPRARHAIVVPDGAGPHQLYDLLVDPVPASSGWSPTPAMAQLRDATALAGAADGQTPTWDAATGEWIPGSGGGGVSDHGLLSGLSDNDHSQYQLTSGRNVANGYAGLDAGTKLAIGQVPTGSTSTTVPLGDHTHDARYYTESEVDASLASVVPATRTVTAGAGLTGGGDLSADRSLAVVFGSTAGTVTQGNDIRLSDSRPPAGSAGGSLTGTYPGPTIAAGAVGGTEIAAGIKDPAAATAGLRTLGTGAQQATAGNDARLSDARTPTAHAASHATGGSDPLTPADIGAAEFGVIYPLSGYGFHSATCAGTEAGVQSTWGSWHTRIWVPAGNAISKAAAVVTVAGTIGAGGLNAFAVYSDDGQTLLGQSADDDTLWAATGIREAPLLASIPAAASGRFVRLLVNVDGYSAAASVAYCVPTGSAGDTINGTGSLQRRSAFKSVYTSWPSTVDPDTLGTPSNFLPFLLLG